VIHQAYLLEQAGIDVAKRFRIAVEQTYARLATMPSVGSPPKSTEKATVKLGFGEYGR